MPSPHEVRRAASSLVRLAYRLERTRAIRMSDFWFLHGVAAAETADRRAAEAPVDTLGVSVGSREQFAAMRDGEFATVGDVATGSLPRLSSLPGVEPGFARAARSAAREVRTRLVASTAPRFTPADPTPAQTSLLRIMSRRVLTDRAALGLREDAVAFARPATRLLPASRAATNPIAHALAGVRARARAADALAQLDALLAPHAASGLGATLAERLKAARVRALGRDAVWEDFRLHPDEYYAVLEDLAGGPRRVARTYGAIPGHLVAAAVAMPFNPTPFRGTLRPYQEFGARFATFQGRLVLGDEDGLGRTVQAVAVMANLAAHGTTRVLVLAPPPLHERWERAVRRYSGLVAIRIATAGNVAALSEWRAVGGVAIATDEVLGEHGSFRASDVALLVVDQAHHVATAPPAAAGRIADLADRTDRVLFLTGVPIAEHPAEILALARIARPDLAATLPSAIPLGAMPPGAVPLDATFAAGEEALRARLSAVYLARRLRDVAAEIPRAASAEPGRAADAGALGALAGR